VRLTRRQARRYLRAQGWTCHAATHIWRLGGAEKHPRAVGLVLPRGDGDVDAATLYGSMAAVRGALTCEHAAALGSLLRAADDLRRRVIRSKRCMAEFRGKHWREWDACIGELRVALDAATQALRGRTDDDDGPDEDPRIVGYPR
jgi:hypothetical protein